MESFRTVEELQLDLQTWMARYDRSWLIARHGYLSPEAARRRQGEEKQKLAA